MVAFLMAFANEAVATTTGSNTVAQTTGDAGFLTQIVNTLHTWSQEGPLGFLMTLVTGLLIVFVGKLLILWLTKILKKIFKRSKKINDLMARFVIRVINIFGWIILAVIFAQHMGFDMGPVLTGLGITGVILGLAFQETIGNLLSGVMIVIIAPFRIGDYIDSGSFSGTVTDMDLICITLSTPDNKKIVISNKLVWGSPIINYSDMEKRRVDLTLSVAYGSDIQKIKAAVFDLLATYPEVLPEPAPMVEVHKLNDSSVDFIVRPWTSPKDYWTIYWRFQGDICKKMDEIGIEIPFNQMDIHLSSDVLTIKQ
ncbi:mechanosensitive ion channel family protein [uncultured Sphaerochaeta sp.]|uniref:mechanosensitive ion channel family protein n=1 Tax=uncultured Sphaerochaeta sp. TaxID=886478 RepID=UPI002A0A2F05|nr:mechanosensitive ion channel family protein [uncultured Sphaerochaeta sp.]